MNTKQKLETATVETLELAEFLNYDTEGFGEYLHLIPDIENRKLDIYKSIGDVGDNRQIKTTVENFKFSLVGENEPNHWYITGGKAATVENWLNSVKWERTETHCKLSWYDDSVEKMTDGTPITEESLWFEYSTDSGNCQTVCVNSAYRTGTQMMAKF